MTTCNTPLKVKLNIKSLNIMINFILILLPTSKYYHDNYYRLLPCQHWAKKTMATTSTRELTLRSIFYQLQQLQFKVPAILMIWSHQYLHRTWNQDLLTHDNQKDHDCKIQCNEWKTILLKVVIFNKILYSLENCNSNFINSNGPALRHYKHDTTDSFDFK